MRELDVGLKLFATATIVVVLDKPHRALPRQRFVTLLISSVTNRLQQIK
eukprot:COSAG01_NODE_4719_length_4794_cov_4.909478_1_plen_49_part_00